MIKKILQLHEKYAPNREILETILVHSQINWEIAQQLIEHNNLDVDKDLVHIGCLVHDIGCYKLVDRNGIRQKGKQGLTHGILGAEILADEGYSQEIQRFASHHTGMGLTKEEIAERKLPLPHRDFVPQTDEEKLVSYVDKFHSKDPQFNSFEYQRRKMAEFGERSVKAFDDLAKKFGKPDLNQLAAKYHQIIG
jgi:uncharacterized domain HDIG